MDYHEPKVHTNAHDWPLLVKLVLLHFRVVHHLGCQRVKRLIISFVGHCYSCDCPWEQNTVDLRKKLVQLLIRNGIWNCDSLGTSPANEVFIGLQNEWLLLFDPLKFLAIFVSIMGQYTYNRLLLVRLRCTCRIFQEFWRVIVLWVKMVDQGYLIVSHHDTVGCRN